MLSVAFYTGYLAVFKVNQHTAIAGTEGAAFLISSRISGILISRLLYKSGYLVR
jgi:hypothetical protein